MAITTYIPSNLQALQPSSFLAGAFTVFLVLAVIVVGYYMLFGVDKRSVPESFSR